MRCFRLFFIWALALGSARLAAAHDVAPPDSVPAGRWYRPHHLIGQFAGGQGMGAVGVGSVAGRRHRLHLDALLGYVPKKYSITPMVIGTAKATFSPWTLGVGASRWQVRPLLVGGRISYTASQGFSNTIGSKYEFGYYWWPAHFRAAGLVGGQVAYAVAVRPQHPPRTVALYYELGLTDLYIVSMWKNIGYLPLSGMLSLGFGVKVDLF